MAQQKSGSKPRPPRPTKQQIEERTDTVMRLLAKGLTKAAVKKVFSELYGLGYRQAEDYIARARAKMFALGKAGRDEIIGESVAHLYSIISNTNSTPRDEIAARDMILKIFGVYVYRTEFEDKTPEAPTSIEESDECLRQIFNRPDLGKN